MTDKITDFKYINGELLSDHYGRLRAIEAQPFPVESHAEQIPGGTVPYLGAGRRGLREYKISLWVYGSSKQEIKNRMDWFVAQAMADGAKISTEMRMLGEYIDYGSCYHIALTSYDMAIVNEHRYGVLTLTCAGWHEGERHAITGTNSVSVTNDAPWDIPVEITVHASATAGPAGCGIGTVTVEGAGQTYYITATEDGDHTYTVNTSRGLIYSSAHNWDAFDIWAFPVLTPGDNFIRATDEGGHDIKMSVAYYDTDY